MASAGRENDRELRAEGEEKGLPIVVEANFHDVENSQDRIDFFQKEHTTINKKTDSNWEALRKHLKRASSRYERYPLPRPYGWIPGNGVSIDEFHRKYLPENGPIALCIKTGQHCFFRALSIIVFGIEDFYLELRIRIFKELVLNKKLYVTDTFLSKATGERTDGKLFEKYASSLEPDKKKRLPLEEQYNKMVIDSLLLEYPANIFHVIAAAQILRRKVTSVCPERDRSCSDTIFMNVTTWPTNCAVDEGPTVMIMWITSGSGDNAQRGPDQFVPLAPIPNAAKDLFFAPHCLVNTNQDGQLQVDEDILRQMTFLDHELVVVAITGLYRTGKSYLLNRLAGRNTGFPLGSTIESKTKGIWMWANIHPYQSEKYLILLDTEGLGDTSKGDETHDAWIFSLAVLLSSVLVYNALGAISEDAIAKLNFITEMSKHIRTNSESTVQQTDNDLHSFAPQFIYVLRDFFLKLEIDGRKVTDDEYLEHCLKLKTGTDERTEKYNLPRNCIKKYFMERKCFTMDTPGGSAQLQELDRMRDIDLSKKFVNDVNKFCMHVFIKGDVKRLESEHGLHGRMWSTIVRNYIDAIRNGAVPCIENAMVAMAKIENSQAVQESIKLWRKLMGDISLPTADEKTLSEAHNKALSAANNHFHNLAIYDRENKFLQQLNELAESEFEMKKGENHQASEVKCKDVLRRLSEGLRKKTKAGGYLKPGGYIHFGGDLHLILKQYRQTEGLGIQDKEVFVQYVEEMMNDGEEIRVADMHLAEKECKSNAAIKSKLEEELMECKKNLQEAMQKVDKENSTMLEVLKGTATVLVQEKERFSKDHEKIEKEKSDLVVKAKEEIARVKREKEEKIQSIHTLKEREVAMQKQKAEAAITEKWASDRRNEQTTSQLQQEQTRRAQLEEAQRKRDREEEERRRKKCVIM